MNLLTAVLARVAETLLTKLFALINNLLRRKAIKAKAVVDGKKKVKAINKAKEEGDEQTYDSNIDNV